MMLFSDSIKRFYTPPLVSVRPTSEWVNFLLFGRLYNVEYQIRYEDSVQEMGEAPDNDSVQDMDEPIDEEF